jgi:hypothetical protein
MKLSQYHVLAIKLPSVARKLDHMIEYVQSKELHEVGTLYDGSYDAIHNYLQQQVPAVARQIIIIPEIALNRTYRTRESIHQGLRSVPKLANPTKRRYRAEVLRSRTMKRRVKDGRRATCSGHHLHSPESEYVAPREASVSQYSSEPRNGHELAARLLFEKGASDQCDRNIASNLR